MNAADLPLPVLGEGAARVLLEALTLPAWVQSGEQLLHANAALQRLSGHDPAVLLALSPLALVVPDDRAVLAQAIHGCLDTGCEPPAHALRLAHRDGSERHVEINLRRIALDGSPALLVTCVDQSDVRHVEHSYQSMSSLLGQIIDGAPVASFVVDAHHRVTHWNSACERLTGCTKQKMIGSTDLWQAFYATARPLLANMIVNGVDEQSLLALYRAAARPSALIAGGYEAETFFPNFGTEGRWLYFTAAPLRNEAGEIIGAIETLQDVSERRFAEQEVARHRTQLEQLVEERSAALATSVRELEAFIDNAPIGVVYTSSGKVLRSNRKMDEVFGLPQGTAVGMSALDFYLSTDDYAALGQVAQPVLSQGLPLHHEMWMRHSSGKPIWMQLSAYVCDHRNTAVGTWWMLQDRTEMRQAQEELRARLQQVQDVNRELEATQNQLLQSDKMASIGQLAAGVAHEINNPVGFVSSNLHSLRQYVGDLLTLVDAYAVHCASPALPEGATRLAQVREKVELDYLKEDLPVLLDECADGLGRVKKIVQDLKDFSRVDQADWQEADLNAGLRSTLNVVQHEVKYRADVVLNLAPLPTVLCLAGQLNQVFMNLIVNASHAIAERGVITLSTGTQGEWVWVQVDDTGCGMTEDVRRRIFEPFYTTKDVGKGTGLGLSLSFSIVQKHGGAILVRSTPGVGSAFRVWVPIAGPQGHGLGANDLPAWD